MGSQVPSEIPQRLGRTACLNSTASNSQEQSPTLRLWVLILSGKTFLKSFDNFFSKKAGRKNIVNRVELMTGAFCFFWSTSASLCKLILT